MVEEPNVALCYGILYFLPSFGKMVLRSWHFPYYVTDLVSFIALFCLCHHVKPGTLHEDVTSIFKSSTRRGGNKLPPPLEQFAREWEQPSGDKRACRIALRTVKYSLPLLLLFDCGMLVGVDGSSRLAQAFVLCLLRSKYLSPIGLVSLALQVLIAHYWGSGKVTDLALLVVGTASIRCTRYLNYQRGSPKAKFKRG